MHNEYVDLPIDEDDVLERTVIVKLHGGSTEQGEGWPQLRDNFVVTEDDCRTENGFSTRALVHGGALFQSLPDRIRPRLSAVEPV